eukprot:Blabericola_migrator_1__4804@NODE_2521_length_2649_cov_252_916344_g1576_i0_p1_GENE_NODE_2521_length_2649_cov_252_916344_g1576_i0NODE_2521_length_2649_cov_252_916344_g1576_i0_p1_ORF_typecomplete_len500_score45_57Glyco_transf_34/PF05637_12/0_0003_NODE_2521_length_2649_cov_252_916344_g1576_i0791578
MRCAPRFTLYKCWWHIKLLGLGLLGLLLVASLCLMSVGIVLRRLQSTPLQDSPEGRILDFTIHVHKNSSMWTPQKTTFLVKELDEPIVCEHVLFHTVTANLLKKEQIFIRRQIEWISLFPEDCFFTVSLERALVLRDPPSPVESLRAKSKIARSIHAYRIKFDALSMLVSLWRNNMIQKPDNGSAPWLLYIDLDVLPMNKEKSIQALLERIARGLKRDTAEERLCVEEPDEFACPPYDPRAKVTDKSQDNDLSRPKTMDDLGFVIALDTSCFGSWMYNHGVWLVKPSRLAGFISLAVLWSFNDTSFQHHHDPNDQGRQALLFREVFDLHPDISRRFCGYPQKESRWIPSLESDELIFVRHLNLHKALTHPVYRVAAQAWFPDGRFWPGEPTAIAITAARWMNSPACRYNYGYSNKKLRYFGFHCGDMFAHFNGCRKSEYKEPSFRAQAVEEEWCRKVLPFQTDDNGTGPFNYKEWVGAGASVPKGSGGQDPHELYQFGY